MMMIAVFTVGSINPEGRRSVWRAMRHFKEFTDPVQAVLFLWSALILWAGV